MDTVVAIHNNMNENTWRQVCHIHPTSLSCNYIPQYAVTVTTTTGIAYFNISIFISIINYYRC